MEHLGQVDTGGRHDSAGGSFGEGTKGLRAKLRGGFFRRKGLNVVVQTVCALY